MAFQPILNPELPLVHELESSLAPGLMLKVQGRVPEGASRFAINYQLGPGLNPRDDVALHVSPRLREGFITRNHIQAMNWGPEENDGPMWIQTGEPFEIIVLCEYSCFKIAVNGRHFTDFAHRVPIDKVTHLTIDGEVEVGSVFFETISIPAPSAPLPDVPAVNVGPPPPGGVYPTLNPDEMYRPAPMPNIGGYGGDSSRVYHPEPQKSEDDAFGSCLDKVGLAVGGFVAAGGVAAAMHAYQKSRQKSPDEADHVKTEAKESESGLGGLGALGAALASSLASNAFQGDKNAHAQQGYPSQDGGMLGSILGALGGGAPQPNYQQPAADPLSGALGSILGGVLGGGSSHQQQPQYQPSGGYSNPQSQSSQSSGGGGSDLLSGLGGALFKSAMDGLAKHVSQKIIQERKQGPLTSRKM
ncbi:uncharacterized protein LOC106643910 isoform X2 [Copidosoma floridanum]|uniref:uncharacterized protein LOC106643910 isoform X2 n=1 Tax=Copidosoma floridanum TaxID=29053 RepID=UPI000C6F930C|nr:uncharacterized protein LOC106643910 isoform X2 [Copidosoma floridanum]